MTLVELIVVITIGVMLTAVGVASFSLVDSRRLKSQAQMLLADFWWARQLAVSQDALDDSYELRFDTINDRYCLCHCDSDCANSCEAYSRCSDPHPANYVKMINLTVDMNAAPTYVVFNSPLGQSITSGGNAVVLRKGTHSIQLNVANDTGYVSW
jgi:Tfp pilus assembly protein PilE